MVAAPPATGPLPAPHPFGGRQPPLLSARNFLMFCHRGRAVLAGPPVTPPDVGDGTSRQPEGVLKPRHRKASGAGWTRGQRASHFALLP